MLSKVSDIFKALICSVHTESSIVQVCVSSSCPQTNRLCCLECVDEHHMGHDHVLISHKKFSNLAQELHALIKEKETLDMKLLEKLKDQRMSISSHVDRYFQLIEDSLAEQNQIGSYDEFNEVNAKTQAQDLKKKINEFVGNQSWMLEINAKENCIDGQNSNNRAVISIREKYSKLERILQEINFNCEMEIKQAVERRKVQVKKLFHLFDQIKYKIEDDGKQLESSSGQISHNGTEKPYQPKTNEDLPQKQPETIEDPDTQKMNSVLDFWDTLVAAEQQ